MTETGIVRKIEKNLVFLNCTSEESCASCAAKGVCKSDQRPFSATNDSGEALSPGDLVRYELPQGKTISVTFMLFLFPLLLFIVFYSGASKLFPSLSELLRIAIAAAGLAAGFMGTLIYGKLRPVHPRIIGKIENT